MTDAYSEWLGIPPGIRPPTYYALLDIEPSELEPAAIAAAADRQHARLRAFESGPHGEDARRLLAEVAVARETLVDPVSRQRYDALTAGAADPWWKPEAVAELPAMVQPVEGWWQGEVSDSGTVTSETAMEPAPEPPRPAITWWKAGGNPAGPAPRSTPPADTGPVAAETVVEPPHLSDPLTIPRERRGSAARVWTIAGIIFAMSGAGATIVAFKPWESAEPENGGQPARQMFVSAVLPQDSASGRGPGKAITIEARPTGLGPNAVMHPAPNLPVGDRPAPVAPALEPLPKTDPAPPANRPTELVTLHGHSGSVFGIAVSSSGAEILSIGDDRAVLRHSLAEPDKHAQLHKTVSPGVAVIICNEDKLAVFCDGIDVFVVDLASRRVRASFENPRGGIRSVAVSRDGGVILTGSTDGCVRWWAEAAGGAAHTLDIDAKASVSSLAIDPEAQHLAVGLSDGKVAVWDLRQRKELRRWAAHKGAVTVLAYSPTGDRFVSAGEDAIATVWTPDGKAVHKLTGHTAPLTGAAWRPDGRRVVTAGIDKTVLQWTEADGWKPGWFSTLPERAFCLALDPQDRFVAVGLSGGSVRLIPLPPAP